MLAGRNAYLIDVNMGSKTGAQIVGCNRKWFSSNFLPNSPRRRLNVKVLRREPANCFATVCFRFDKSHCRRLWRNNAGSMRNRRPLLAIKSGSVGGLRWAAVWGIWVERGPDLLVPRAPRVISSAHRELARGDNIKCIMGDERRESPAGIFAPILERAQSSRTGADVTATPHPCAVCFVWA